MVAIMAFQTGIRSKVGRMAVGAGCAVVARAASFTTSIGVIEAPVVDGVARRTVGTEPDMIGRCIMAGGAGRGKSYKHTGRMATIA